MVCDRYWRQGVKKKKKKKKDSYWSGYPFSREQDPWVVQYSLEGIKLSFWLAIQLPQNKTWLGIGNTSAQIKTSPSSEGRQVWVELLNETGRVCAVEVSLVDHLNSFPSLPFTMINSTHKPSTYLNTAIKSTAQIQPKAWPFIQPRSQSSTYPLLSLKPLQSTSSPHPTSTRPPLRLPSHVKTPHQQKDPPRHPRQEDGNLKHPFPPLRRVLRHLESGSIVLRSPVVGIKWLALRSPVDGS